MLIQAEFPELVGVSEMAEILGVSKQRVSQLAQTPDFPEPVAKLRATTVWIRADIEQYAHDRVDRRLKHLGIPRSMRD